MTALAHNFATESSEGAALSGLSAMADEALARRAQGGCGLSFEELVRRYQVPLLHFLLQRCRNKHDAEDVSQESFLQAYRALHRYSDHWPFRTWLYTLSSRLAISQARKAAPASDSPPLLALAGVDDPPARRMEEQESQQKLWDIARAVLSEEQFTGLFLQYVEDMPTDQIATIMGKSWVATKTLLHRARRKLQAEVENPFSAGGRQ